MKILEKFVLIVYSLLILIISSIICLLVFRIVSIDNLTEWTKLILNDTPLTIVVLSIAIICILTSIRCLFFRNRKQIKKSTATDILLENESGRLLISKNAIENTVKNVINDSANSKPETKVTIDIDPANNLSIYIAILLDTEIKVRDFTIGLQMKIKNKIKENFDLEVKQVNIKIDNIERKEEKKELNTEKKEIEKVNIIETENNTVN